MKNSYKILQLFLTILLCILFGFVTYFAFEDKVVKADTIELHSSQSNFDDYYKISYSKLTNDSNNIYNSNSNVVSTCTFSSNSMNLIGDNYLFLGRFGLNFSSLSASEFNSFPDRFSYTYNSLSPIFRLRGLAQSDNGSDTELWFGTKLEFVKAFDFANGVGYYAYLDLNSILNYDSDLFFNVVRGVNSISFDYNSVFFDNGLHINDFVIIPNWASVSRVTEAFRDGANFTFPRSLNDVTSTDLEFDISITFNWNLTNSYYANINYFRLRGYYYRNNTYSVYNIPSNIILKSNNGNIINIDNLNMQTSLFDCSILSLSSTGLLLNSIKYNHVDNAWNNRMNSAIHFSFIHNSNLSNNLSFNYDFNNSNSSDLYKNDVQWYDIFGHLYNFMIYLIFDMPLISNITKPIYMLISGTSTTFNWLAGCVAGLGIFGAFAMCYLLFAIIKRFL